MYDVVVIGGGPSGLAAAVEAKKEGAKVIVIEREAMLGGILKQCIHDGFGLIRFGKKLSGPEYAEMYIKEASDLNIETKLSTFVTSIKKFDGVFHIFVTSSKGIEEIESKTIVLATGCRERTARQVFIHGTRPVGVYTAGTAQNFVNHMGYLPVKNCVILGSGDIGLIMARRLTLEGAKVIGVYEIKSTPSGLTRNIHQCLKDFNIPLYLSYTVTRVFGEPRLTGIEVAEVDQFMKIKPGTEKYIECDGLILSVGLIPENELAETIGVKIDQKTKGPEVNEKMMTNIDGVFSCGNALHVHDLVDFVSEGSATAGYNAAKYTDKKDKEGVVTSEGMLSLVPQRITEGEHEIIFYFRTLCDRKKATLTITTNGNEEGKIVKKYTNLLPPEMERVKLKLNVKAGDKINFKLEGE